MAEGRAQKDRTVGEIGEKDTGYHWGQESVKSFYLPPYQIREALERKRKRRRRLLRVLMIYFAGLVSGALGASLWVLPL